MPVNIFQFQGLLSGQLFVILVPGTGQGGHRIMGQDPILNPENSEGHLGVFARKRVVAGALTMGNNHFTARIDQGVNLGYWITHGLVTAGHQD